MKDPWEDVKAFFRINFGVELTDEQIEKACTEYGNDNDKAWYATEETLNKLFKAKEAKE